MIAIAIGVMVLLVVVSVTLASVEAAFYLVKRRRLSHLEQNPRAELVNRYLEDPQTLLMPIHMGTYTAHVVMTVIITMLLTEHGHIHPWALAGAVGFMILYLLLFRLTLPYSLVWRNPERALLMLLPAFHAYARALRPLASALRRRAKSPTADEAETNGAPPLPEVPPAPVHDENEGRLVDAVARFSVTQVRDVMTPRPDIVALSATSTIADLRRLLRETKYSRVPVYNENLDDIVGVVGVRDLVEYDGASTDPLRPLVREAYLVPETKKVAELLKEFQARRITFALAIDEYGSISGLVTVEDIVEEIVGEIKDEYDLEAEPISIEPDGAFLVAGRVNVDRLEQALEAKLADDDVGTVGGLVASAFGRIPRPGEKMDYRGFMVEVVDAERKRVHRVRFRRKPAEDEG
jgi:CBS domain containing-hemolysin-like protein